MGHIINIIGIGLDGVNSLSTHLLEKINTATILAGSDRLLHYFPQFGGKKVIFKQLNQAIDQLKLYYQQGENIVILATGDPLFFGIGRLLLEHFKPEILNFHPHLSSIQLAFNRLKIPWQDAQIITGHGRSLEDLIPLLKKGAHKIFILTDQENSPQAIARLYLSLDLPTNYNFYIGENLGGDQEKFTSFIGKQAVSNLGKISDQFASLNVVILLREEIAKKSLDLDNLPLMGLPDQLFLTFPDRPALLTKKEIRVNILSELKLQDKQTIWDVGAGTGSVSIEMARLVPNGVIYAIEKTAMGVNLITQNSQRFHLSNITVIGGEAPEILTNLPAPDRIFIGGSTGKIQEILTLCYQKLNSQGIIVLALATLQHFQKTLIWCEENQHPYQVLQLQISRSLPFNNLTRLAPLNPINLISIEKTSDIIK